MLSKKHLWVPALSLALAGNLFAVPVNITIPDGQGTGGEDNETEPGTVRTDAWDLEALGYDSADKKLDVIGTYNFRSGESGTTMGAIFVSAGSSIPSPGGWSYAYVLNFANNTFGLYDSFTIRLPDVVSASSPWSINTSTAHLLAAGTFFYYTGLSNPDSFGLTTISPQNADQHNLIRLSLGNLPTEVLDGFVVHTTPTCGNDELEGRYQSRRVPDGGATFILLGLAGIGLLAARKNFCLN
jgi:hypothetical protein